MYYLKLFTFPIISLVLLIVFIAIRREGKLKAKTQEKMYNIILQTLRLGVNNIEEWTINYREVNWFLNQCVGNPLLEVWRTELLLALRQSYSFDCQTVRCHDDSAPSDNKGRTKVVKHYDFTIV